MSKKHFRRVLVVLFALLVVLPAGTGRAAAAGYDGITAAWEKGDAVYVHVRCTQENARLFYAAFSEDDRFLGAQTLPVASGTDKTYLFTAPTGTARGTALLLSDGMQPLAECRVTEQRASAPSSGAYSITVGESVYQLGQTVDELLQCAGKPDETLSSTEGYRWYVFGTETYEDFFLAGVYQDKVVSLSSAGPAFSWEGLIAGDVPDNCNPSLGVHLYVDKNDSSILHAVMLRDYNAVPKTSDTSAEALYGEARVIFHMTNAFRLFHQHAALQWSDAAAEAAQLHSQDLADKNYFSHYSLDGRGVRERIEAQGIQWRSLGENIAAGSRCGVDSYDQWVNSHAGHRENMLENWTHLGVGCGYNGSSDYKYYATQDYYIAR